MASSEKGNFMELHPKKGTFKKSANEFGQLYPVIISADGEVLDGKHRLDEVPNWKKVKLESVKDKRDKLKVTIIANFQRRTMPPEELRQLLTDLAKELCKKREEKAQGVQTVFKFLNGCVPSRTIYRYLPKEFKREYKAREIRQVAKSETKKENMYKDTVTWNPFVGCAYNCTYCKPSFQKLVKLAGTKKTNSQSECRSCQDYLPHEHEKRLDLESSYTKSKFKESTIFVCGISDIFFATAEYMKKIFKIMREDKKDDRLWFIQSKNPKCFGQYLKLLPQNTYLLTTLETNRGQDYDKVSQAPVPSQRFKDFMALKWNNKIVTVEPIMDFDMDTFVNWITSIKPKAVFIGYNSHPTTVPLQEPDMEKTLDLIVALKNKGIRVLLKKMRKMAYRDFSQDEKTNNAKLPKKQQQNKASH